MVIPFALEPDDDATRRAAAQTDRAPVLPLADDPVLLFSPSTLIGVFGDVTVEDGIELYRRRQVHGLARGPRGEVLAWVRDQDKPEHEVSVLVASRDDVFLNGCGCERTGFCRHVVAVLLAVREAVARGVEPPAADPDDPRLALLTTAGALRDQISDASDAAELDALEDVAGADLDFQDELDDLEDLNDVDDDLGLDELPPPAPRSGMQPTLPPHLQQIHAFLADRSADELREALWDLAALYATVQSALLARQRLMTEGAAAIVAEAREQVERARAYTRAGYPLLDRQPPDYPTLVDRLRLLMRRGESRAIAELGRELVRGAPDPRFPLVESAAEWTQVILILVIEALAKSDLPAVEKAEWAVGALKDDKVGILPELDRLFQVELDRSAWKKLANQLVKALYGRGVPPPRPPEVLQPPRLAVTLTRARQARLAARLLVLGGEPDRAEVLLVAEAHQYGAILPLVQWLRDAGRADEAIRWARAGLGALRAMSRPAYQQLFSELRQLVAAQQDWPLLASLSFDELLRQPSDGAYRRLRAAAERAGVWETVRAALLRYFETGERAWSGRGGRPAPDWPLPPSGVPQPPEPPRLPGQRWPSYGDLVEIALVEGRAEDALDLYRRWREQYPGAFGADGPSSVTERLASALARERPDDAVALWTELAHQRIAEGNIPSYQLAGVYLAEAGYARARQGRLAEWEREVAALAEQHRRKHRLRKILKEVVWQVAGQE